MDDHVCSFLEAPRSSLAPRVTDMGIPKSYIRKDVKTLIISSPIHKEYVQNIIECPSKSKSLPHFPCFL